nr:MAG TPA: hypothetical protein [Caudoviricetes sp.]DAT27354.1 MAG TPA: hypothetical protein [Caudoviricetes sp.]
MLSVLLDWILYSKILSTIRIYDSLKNNHPNQISLPIAIGFRM